MSLRTARLVPALLAAPLVVSCGDKAVYDDTGEVLPYCYTPEDGDTHYVETGGGNGQSGKLYGRLITGRSDDVHDPNFVANVEYTLQNANVGGGQQVGATETGGDFVETLGAGDWTIKVSTQKQGYTCENEYVFGIEAGDTTYLCLEMNCN